jgi:hypothetical protein
MHGEEIRCAIIEHPQIHQSHSEVSLTVRQLFMQGEEIF